MKPFDIKSTLGAILAGSLFATVGLASAAEPFPCTFSNVAFVAACQLNNEMATNDPAAETAAYTGSCSGGGNCDDSVHNKLVTADAAIYVAKQSDACNKLADIVAAVGTWAGAAKPKVNAAGRLALIGNTDKGDSQNGEITALQRGFGCAIY
jgi:hypothetical protein